MTEARPPSTAIAHLLHAALLVVMLAGLNAAGITPEVMSANGWWTAFLVVHAGILLGNLAMAVLLQRGDAASLLAAEGRHQDLSDSRAIVIEQLRNLESERHKLSDDDYTRERTALVAVGAEASRQLDQGPTPSADGAPMSQDPTTDPVTALVGRLRQEQMANPAAFEQALSRLGLGGPPASAIPGEWKGAGYALLLVGIIAILSRDAGQSAKDRAPGMGMTGGDSIGMSEAPMQNSEPSTIDPETQALNDRLAANPNDLEAINLLTERALGRQDLKKAMELNARALEVAPKDQDARVYQQVLRAFIGRRPEALIGLDEVLAENPVHHRALVYRGLLSMQDEPAKAVEVFERAVAIEDSPQLQQALAEARARAAGGGMPPEEPPPSAAPTLLAKGTITLAPAASAATGQVTFVSLRPAAGGPPIAALKLPPGPFPLTFEVTTADLLPMAGNRPVPDSFQLVARLDSDGDAFSRPETDPAAEQAVSKGAVDLQLVLD